MQVHSTREDWLVAGMEQLDRAFFAEKGYELPERLKVSCGFAYGGKSDTIGQAFPPDCTEDETHHMFVCPSLGDPIKVLATLLHEMIHQAVGCDQGHRRPFRKLALEFGLAGKMTSTYAEEGSDLWHQLCVIRDRLGPYPHSPIKKIKRKGRGGGNWVRLMSTQEETYTLTMSPKKLEEHGPPTDPWGEEMVPVE